MAEPPARPPMQSQRSGPRLGAIAVVIIAAGLVLWLLLRARDDDNNKTSRPAATSAKAQPPTLANTRELRRLAAGLGYPVYWAGRIPRRKVELTQTASGNVFLRYLTVSARVGDPRPDFLTVGTYPLKDAFTATR